MPRQGNLLQGDDAIPLSLSLSVDEEWMQLLIHIWRWSAT
jgi:hypothetical protein